MRNFFGAGFVVVCFSLMMLLAKSVMGSTPIYGQSQAIQNVLMYVLGISIVIYNLATISVVIFALALLVFAAKKLVELFQSTHRAFLRRFSFQQASANEATFAQLGFFKLFCRYLN